VARFHSLFDTEFASLGESKEDLFDKAIAFEKKHYRAFLEGHKVGFPKVTIVTGREREGDFLVKDGIPTIRIFRSFDSWILTLFHEFHHFLEWVRNPVHFNETYLHFKDIEDTFAERNAVEDWSDFAGALGRSDLEIPGTQVATYVRRHYGNRSRL
jgi:hypothetical protein